MTQAGRRKKKRKVLSIIKVLFHVMMIALLLALSGLTVYRIWLDNEKAKQPIFENVSMVEEVSAKAYVWLNQIEDMPLTYEDVKQIMGELTLTVVLTPAQVKGTYTQALEEDSYEECLTRAKKGFEKAYRETVRHRFAAAGYEGEITEDMLDDLMREAYGVSVSEYLAFCDVQLLPEREKLAEEYSGEVTR